MVKFVDRPPSGMVHPKSPVQFWTEIKNWFATHRTTFPSFPPGCFHQGFMKPMARAHQLLGSLTARSFLSTKFRQGQSAGAKCDFQFLQALQFRFQWGTTGWMIFLLVSPQTINSWISGVLKLCTLKHSKDPSRSPLEHYSIYRCVMVRGLSGDMDLSR